MRKTGRLTIGVAIAACAAILVLGGVALATITTPGDFAPFTMRVTYWTSAASQREGFAPEAGTAVSTLEYRGIEQWKVTVMSSTWDPDAVGTVVEVNNGTHSTFVAQARKLMSRIIPVDEAGKMGPYRWVYPGVLQALPQQGFVQVASSPAGTVTFAERSASAALRADGTVDVVSGTVVIFESGSGLPRSVKTYRDGTLRESLQFDLASRP